MFLFCADLLFTPFVLFRMASGEEWTVVGGLRKRKAPVSQSVAPGPAPPPDPVPGRASTAAAAVPAPSSAARDPEGPHRPAVPGPPVGCPQVSVPRVFRSLEVCVSKGSDATRADLVAALAEVVALRDIEAVV